MIFLNIFLYLFIDPICYVLFTSNNFVTKEFFSHTVVKNTKGICYWYRHLSNFWMNETLFQQQQ